MINFKERAKEAAGTRWKRMDDAQRRAAVRRAKAAWLRERTGQGEERPTYGEWLALQPPARQDEILGVTRARLFRAGGLTIDRFTDPAGRSLTLAELAAKVPAAFTRAGLNPGDFKEES